LQQVFGRGSFWGLSEKRESISEARQARSRCKNDHKVMIYPRARNSLGGLRDKEKISQDNADEGCSTFGGEGGSGNVRSEAQSRS